MRLWEHGKAAGHMVAHSQGTEESLNSGGQFVFFVLCSGEPRLWDGVAHIWGVFHLNQLNLERDSFTSMSRGLSPRYS